MKVSINIPVYKCEKYILRCLESVKSQTYKNLEIILVNDQTPDNSLEIVEKFIVENPALTIKLIHHPENMGLSVVRNTGIDNSTGKYIYFLDSDDEITEDCIELLVNDIESKKVEMVIAQNRWVDMRNHSTKDFGFPTHSLQKVYRNNESIFQAYSENKFPVVSWNKLISLDFIRTNNIYFVPGLFAQDELWFFHLILKINSLSIIDNITYWYYLHSESVIFNRTKRNFENHQTIVEWFTKAYKESNHKRKQLIKKKLIEFKETTLLMQWKSMRDDVPYWKQNYARLKKAPALSLSDYFSPEFSFELKKKNFFQNLPVELGFRIFKSRFERK
ncbi:MAG: glycosyltransferase [Moheibacter sp.]